MNLKRFVYKSTSEDAVSQRRHKIIKLRAGIEIIKPWIQYIFEQGREQARNAITEMDVTAQFQDTEDKMIALFASLAAKTGREDFATTDVWQIASPHDMVYKRFFTEVNGRHGFSVIRFKRLMDILWQWTQDYGSVYDAFNVLVNDPDPTATLEWMMGEQIPIEKPEFRIPRFIMALMLNDEGIGQGILPHQSPENLTVPICVEVNKLKRSFCPLRNSCMGEVADIMGLEQESDLYYLAIGWDNLCTQQPNYTKRIVEFFQRIVETGGHDRNQRDPIKRLLRVILPDANPAIIPNSLITQ